MNYNRTLLAGNLTRDPELKFLPNGKAICSFTIAHNKKWKTPAGEEKEKVSFIDHTAFGKTGEAIAKFLKKGSPIFTEGEIEQQNWDDKATGQKRSKLVVIVESFQFVGGKRDSEQQPAGQQAKPAAANLDDGSDVPF